MKRLIGLLFLFIVTLSGCGNNNQEYTQDNPLVLTMAHGIADQSETGKKIAEIEPALEAASNNTIDMRIYGSGVLGSERDTIELVQAGVLDMAKVGASSLDGFEPMYSIFSLPFLFDDENHLYSAMENTNLIEKLNEKTKDDGFVMIGWYPSGARNFYTAKDKPILSPDDLKGMKIRVMESATATNMVKLLGGSPVPMASSETYTAMEQGVIDGAENNELALTSNNHKEVTKHYSYTQHQMVPDIYIISTKTLDRMTDAQKKLVKDVIWQNNLEYRTLNNQLLQDARKESEEAGVQFHDNIDKEPFRKLVMPMHEDFRNLGPEYAQVYDDVVASKNLEGSNDDAEN